MKILNVLGLFVAALMLSFSAYGQQMPVGTVMSTVSCNLNEGVSMGEVVEWARANPRSGGSTNLVFFRQPIIANPNFANNYDFRIATYFTSYAEMISQGEARANRSSNAPRVRPTPLPRDMFSCNGDTLAVSLVRNLPDGDVFTGDSSLLSSRLCFLNEDNTQADAYNFVEGIAAGFRRGGDNTLMQVATRAFGPIQSAATGQVRAGGAVTVSSVSATADLMAARLDLTREGLNVGAGLDAVMACGFPELWRTHAVYRGNN
jgi:hypothetical protein